MTTQQIIAAKRDRRVHSAGEIQAVIRGATDGSWTDDQLAAWLMAAFLNGLNPAETAELTKAMAESGERLDLTGLPQPWVDKHSTGGVGDKTTLVLLPLLASCGLTMVKMSGRGLGKTGGTIDKLESIPGFRTDLSPAEMIAQARMVGCALTGQTPKLAPADGRLYALRGATATVESIPLIVASILSKKMAGGAEVVVLDVKCGRGAFMTELPRARELKAELENVGREAGLKVRALVTDMDQPLGRAAGNALEVKEAIRVLKGEESGRFTELCL
ncbi:MAG: thymidine phosphorylase, partial [Fimbriimonadaceae bacterium]|nr:thymidine phosphorylase [Fimbriimonadaceae bacterium]